MPSRTLTVCIVLLAAQAATAAEEHSLLVAERVVNEKGKATPVAKEIAVQTTPDTSAKATAAPAVAVFIAEHRTSDTPKPAPPSDKAVRIAAAPAADRFAPEQKSASSAKGHEQQILVNVEIFEVSVTKLRRMGTDFPFSNGDCSSLEKAIKTFKPEPNQAKANNLSRHAVPFLDWLDENRVGKWLASPSIVVASDRPGQFFVGGEFPVKKREGEFESVMFQRFGTEMDVLATTLDKDRVQLQLRTKISNIAGEQGPDDAGNKLPILDVRQCSATVSTHFGEPVVLGGLAQNRSVTEKVKDLESGQVKVVDTNDEIALFVLALPKLVAPTEPAEPKTADASQKKPSR